MAGRGKKQSPFIGRRVPLVEDGVPLLYARYTAVEDILLDGPGARKRAAPPSQADPAEQEPVANGLGAQTQPTAKKAKRDKKAKQQPEREQQPAPQPAAEPDSDEPTAPEPEPRELSKKEKKERKKREKRDAAAAAAKAAAAAAAGEGGAEPAEQPGGSHPEAAGDQGNAAEAARMRAVLGFTSAAQQPAAAAAARAAKAAPPGSGFAFNFAAAAGSPSAPAEARVAAQTEAKLAAIQAVDSADKDGFIPRRVFVGGMPYSYDADAVADYWSWCGAIEALDTLTFPDSGRFRGIAFITFASQEGADAALACNGEQLEGQTLKVERCKAAANARHMRSALAAGASSSQQQQQQQEQPDAAAQQAQRQPAPSQPQGSASGGGGGAGPAKTPGYNVAHVCNIAFEARPEDLSALFAGCNVTKVRLHTDKASGKSKGYAHLHFADEAGLERALGMSGSQLHGRGIKVSYGQPKRN